MYALKLVRTAVAARAAFSEKCRAAQEELMIIRTKYLGYVEVEEENIIRFPRGIYGFPDAARFVILKDRNEENPFMWLQCAGSQEPCFVVTDPKTIFPGYAPDIPARALEEIGLKSADALRIVVIVTVPEDKDLSKITFNLKCPVVINAIENNAVQAILEDDRYSMRVPLRRETEAQPCSC